jgi:hypothetical protein
MSRPAILAVPPPPLQQITPTASAAPTTSTPQHTAQKRSASSTDIPNVAEVKKARTYPRDLSEVADEIDDSVNIVMALAKITNTPIETAMKQWTWLVQEGINTVWHLRSLDSVYLHALVREHNAKTFFTAAAIFALAGETIHEHWRHKSCDPGVSN